MNKTTGNLVLITLVFGCVHQAEILTTNIREEMVDQKRERVLKEVLGPFDEAQSQEKTYVLEEITKETI
ncbi:hypothetical protein ABIB38_004793 [Massilia sp. UYP11]|uniref:hypothetical protein n=1 Tax=Massilia sp. UYP11 TaxID=1756385 RepID=UPI003D1A04FD